MRKLLLLLLLFTASFLFAQTKIKGQVIDFDTTIPISFATILYNGQTTTTDWEGRFTLIVTDYKKPIVFKYKGYYEKFAYANNKTTFLLIKAVTDLNQKNKKSIPNIALIK